MNSKTLPAIIHAVLASGATATAPFYDLVIEQQLCRCVCVDDTPLFAPTVTVQSIENVGTSQYLVNMHVEGAISYIPCGCGACESQTQVLSQDFSVPIYSATAITGATPTIGVVANAMHRRSCERCNKHFVCEVPLTLTLTTA